MKLLFKTNLLFVLFFSFGVFSVSGFHLSTSRDSTTKLFKGFYGINTFSWPGGFVRLSLGG